MTAATDCFGLVTVLFKRRLKSGATREAVAAHIGITQQALAQWETRRVIPKADNLCAWARALGCKVGLEEVGT